MARENPIDADDEVRRRWLIQALAAGAWFGTALAGRSAWAAGALGGRPEKLPPGQSVYRITGKVLIDGQPCAADTRIAANATIETAAGGELIFVVGASAMLLRGDSQLALQPTAAGSGSTEIGAVRLTKGKLLSVFGGGQRQLSTPTARIGIKGTGVYLEVDPEQTYFCTCYGTADVQSVVDPTSRDTVVSKHHDKPLYILRDGQPGAQIRAAPFVNHTDQELMLIETLVGRTPPFVFPVRQYNTPRPGGGYGR